jgi:hypothetical protein
MPAREAVGLDVEVRSKIEFGPKLGMNRVSSTCFNRVIAHPITKQRLASSRVLHSRLAGLSAARTKSHKASPNAEKRENDQVGHSKTEKNIIKDEERVSAKDDTPLPYRNTTSEWEDTSFLTPYFRKYPALYKGAKLLYDGMSSFCPSVEATENLSRTGIVYEARRRGENRKEGLHGVL